MRTLLAQNRSADVDNPKRPKFAATCIILSQFIPFTLDASSPPADSAIELKPVRPPKAQSAAPQLGVLDIYNELRQQERDKQRLEKLERAFVGADADDAMKFSHSIQFNAVPDWSNQYVAYSNLKKLIYTLEKEVNQRTQALANDAESTHLLDSVAGDPDTAFAQALDQELRKIETFYQSKEAEIFKDVEDLLQDEEALTAGAQALEASEQTSSMSRRRSHSGTKAHRDSLFRPFSFSGGGRRRTSISRPIMERIESEDEDSDEEPDERNALTRSSTIGSSGRLSVSGKGRRRTSFGMESDHSDVPMSDSTHLAATTKKRMVSLYVSLCELKSYLQLNRTGFSKVLKKYDKTLDKKLKQSYISSKVDTAPTFQSANMDKLNDKLSQVEQTYADIYTEGDVEKAKRELRLDLREHVVWERNTVWREMIGIERKAQAAHLGVRPPILGKRGEHKQGDEESRSKELGTPAGKYRCPTFLFNTSLYVLIAAFVVFMLLLFIPMFHLPEQQNCLAMVVFVSILWATEVSWPVYVLVISSSLILGNSAICNLVTGPILGGSAPHR